MQPEQALKGGHRTSVVRIGDAVHRDAGPWTPQVHRLLALLHARGVVGVPTPLGMDPQGREVLSNLHGEAGASPLGESHRSDAVVMRAAELLRALHDATADVAQAWSLGGSLPSRAPAEVICHGDVAPYSCVFVSCTERTWPTWRATGAASRPHCTEAR